MKKLILTTMMVGVLASSASAKVHEDEATTLEDVFDNISPDNMKKAFGEVGDAFKRLFS